MSYCKPEALTKIINVVKKLLKPGNLKRSFDKKEAITKENEEGHSIENSDLARNTRNC